MLLPLLSASIYCPCFFLSTVAALFLYGSVSIIVLLNWDLNLDSLIRVGGRHVLGDMDNLEETDGTILWAPILVHSWSTNLSPFPGPTDVVMAMLVSRSEHVIHDHVQ